MLTVPWKAAAAFSACKPKNWASLSVSVSLFARFIDYIHRFSRLYKELFTTPRYLTHSVLSRPPIAPTGQYKAILEPGFHCLMWPFMNIVGKLSLCIQQLDVYCKTKTKDNVFVQVAVAVQYRVIAEGAYDAYYRLTDPKGQIQSYVFDVVRSTVPKMELDEAFSSKDEIADSVLQQLNDVMKEYGYEIRNTLVTDLSPDSKVKASMNEINASRRLKEAASHKAEADKVKQVKMAEGEAEACYLSGLGVARQRKAIVSGLQASVSEFSEEVEGYKPKDVSFAWRGL